MNGLKLALLTLGTLLCCGVALGSPLFSARSQLSTSAAPPLAALSTAGHGYNAYTGQSGLAQIINTTFAQGKSWKSPVTGAVFSVADQFSLATVSNSFTITAQGFLTGFAVGAQTYFNAFQAHLGATLGKSSFTASLGFHHLMKQLSTFLAHGHVKFSFIQYRAVEFHLNAAPAFVLTATSQFTSDFAALPESSSGSGAAAYSAFITKYGTHYVCRGEYGGGITELGGFAEETVKLWSASKCINQMNLAFHQQYFNASSGITASASDIMLDDWFKESYLNASSWEGGNKTMQGNLTGIAEWIQTIPDNAALVGARLCPLSHFMEQDATRKAAFESAVDALLGS